MPTLTLDQSLATTPLGVQPLNFLPQRSHMSARGYYQTFAFLEETAYGATPGSPSMMKFIPEDFTLMAAQGRLPNQDIDGTRTETEPALDNMNVSGSLTAKLNAEWLVYFLKHLLGTNATTGANPYTHTITPAGLPEGLQIEVDHGSQMAGNARYELFTGLRINRGTFTFPPSGWPTGNFDFVGANRSYSSSPVDATVTNLGHNPFTAFQISLTEGGSALAIAKSLTLTIDNQLNTDGYTIGTSGIRNSLEEGKAKITMAGMFKFTNESLLLKAKNGTETSMTITLSRGDGLGSSGNESLVFTINQMKYDSTSPRRQGNGPILIELNGQTYRSSGGTAPLTVVAKNQIATI